jgi:hypothetical protein
MTYENTKTVTAADALKLDEESKTKVANFVRAASENKRKKNPETDAYNILDNTSEPDVPIKSKFSDVGYGSEDVDYQDTN